MTMGPDDNATTNAPLGQAACPLRLGTAFSGTDATALAMTLVQEQFELRGHSHLLHQSHELSPEVDPLSRPTRAARPALLRILLEYLAESNQGERLLGTTRYRRLHQPWWRLHLAS